MAVTWLLSKAAWDHFVLNVKPDLSWSMLIILPLFFVVAGAALSAVAALLPFFNYEQGEAND